MSQCRYLLLILSIFLAAACQNKKNSSQTNELQDSKDDEPCRQMSFKTQYSKEVIVKSQYLTCEPEWKFNLEFLINDHVVYKTDSLLEYEFGKYEFPVLIQADEVTYILIERNDRPFLNKLDVFAFKSGQLNTLFTIPFFEQAGKDLDNDGMIEYYATMDFMEIVEPGKIGYNPILAYEITDKALKFDTIATVMANKKVYGEFYGLKADITRLFNANQVENNWP